MTNLEKVMNLALGAFIAVVGTSIATIMVAMAVFAIRDAFRI